MKNSHAFFSGLIVFAVMIIAQPSYGAGALDFTIHQEYTSTRALGMGNAFSAVADDHSAIFYNPAALARRKEGTIRMFLRGGIDSGYLGLVDDIQGANSLNGAAEVNKMFDIIEDNYGNHFYSRIPTIGGVWVRPNWGVAIIPMDLSIDMSVHQLLGPQININAYADTTFAYSYARNVNWLGKDKGLLSAGATLKGLHRIYYSEAVSAGELADDSTVFQPNRGDEGMTLDVDLGLLWTPKISENNWTKFLKHSRPTFSAVMRNALDYGFPINFHLMDENSGEPPGLQRRIDLGGKFDLPNFWIFDPHASIDIRDILHENWSFMKGFHAGAEVYWKMKSWWKGHWAVGVNQGYFTAGIGAKFALFQIDLATWGEEVGMSTSRQESRRYILEMSLDF